MISDGKFLEILKRDTIGKGDELLIIPVINRRQRVRKDLGAR